MCGRFTLLIPPELLAEIFGLLEIPAFPARYNIAPTRQAPVILLPEAITLWLDRETSGPERLNALYHPFPRDLMEIWPVSPKVNSPCNDSPELIAPLS